jgi:glycosyltransferase involved in cell wall biosynthesis
MRADDPVPGGGPRRWWPVTPGGLDTRGEEPPAVELTLDVSAVPQNPAGAGRYIIELVRALASRDDVALELVARRGDGSRWPTVAPGAPVHELVPARRPARLAYERLWLGRRREVARRAGSPGRTSTTARVEPPPVYHGPHYTLPGWLPPHVGRVATIHDLTFFDHPEWHERSKVRFFRSAIVRSARVADAVVCVSATTARRLGELVTVRGEVVVAEHGVDPDRFRPAEVSDRARAELAERLGGRDGELVVHVGTIEPRKGVVDLVEAFSRLAASRPRLRLALAGVPGWGVADVEAAVGRSAHRDRIAVLGWVPDETISALLSAAAVVAYPSRQEGFGLPALEAMAAGVPLVTTAGTVMAELSEGVAWLAEPGRPDSLAAALEAALGARAEERERRLRAGLAAAARFTWARTADSHLEAYRIAAAAASRRRSR